MIISVTDEHIKSGSIVDCSFCPIALALKDAGFLWPRVQEHLIEVTDAGLVHDTYHLTRSAQRFIRAFDAGKPVKPFRFRLEAVHAD